MTNDRVDARDDDQEAEQEHHDPGEREARRAGVVAVLAPLPAEELRDAVRTREAGVDRGPGHGEEHPDEREDEADLPERRLRDERARAEQLGVDPLRQQERAGRDHQREGEQAAERVADRTRSRGSVPRSFGVQRSSTAPDE